MSGHNTDDLNCLFVCRACLAILPTDQVDSSNCADDLFRIAGVKVPDIIPVSLCRQCKDVVTLFKSFRIQVMKANVVFTDLTDKFQSGKMVTAKNIIEERRKYILPRIILTAKDDKKVMETIEEQAKSTHEIQAAIKVVEVKSSDLKNLGVTFASNLVSDVDAVVRSAYDIKQLRCTDGNCNKVFPTIATLKKHMSTEHMRVSSDITGKFYCPVADCKHGKPNKPFANRGLLRQHYIKVHLQKTFTCATCDMKFPTVAIRSRHEKFCSQNIVCGVCNIRFLKQASLVSHTMRKHPRKYEEELLQRKISRSTSKTIVAELTGDSNAGRSHSTISATEPAPNKVLISMTRSNKSLTKGTPDRITENVQDDAQTETVDGCSVRTPTTYAVFSDQFTQTSIKTVRKQKSQTMRTSAETQTFECSTYNKGTGFNTNIDTRTGTNFIDEATGQDHNDHVMVHDAEVSVNHMKIPRTSTNNNPSPLLSFSSDYRQSVACNQATQSNSATIETQTALDELQYSNMHHDINSNLFPELVSLSDIQTQTVWNDIDELMCERQNGDDFGSLDLLNCFDKRSMLSEIACEKSLGNRGMSPIPPSPMPMDLLSNLTSSPDLTFRGTQTYFFFNDSPKQSNLMNHKWV